MTKAMPQDGLSDDKDQEGYDSQEDLITFGSTSSEAGQTPNSKTHPCMLALRAIEIVKMGENDNNMGIRITTTEDFPVSSLIHQIYLAVGAGICTQMLGGLGVLCRRL